MPSSLKLLKVHRLPEKSLKSPTGVSRGGGPQTCRGPATHKASTATSTPILLLHLLQLLVLTLLVVLL